MITIDVWQKLETESPIGEKINARLAFPDISKKLYAGLDSIKKRHLLISLNNTEESYQDLLSKGLSVVTRDLVIKDSKPQRYIDITCHDISGYTIFDIIGKEIAEKLNNDNSREVVMNVIFRWRNFWSKSLRELLSSNEITGLFAELWFLYYWMLPTVDKFEAVNRWRGPFASRHDFEWTGKSVEVKSTTNVQSRVHKIHGIDQLSPPENGELFLFSLRLREEQGADKNLPQMIALCKEKLNDDIDALSKFENTLVITGYSPVYEEEYSKLKFRVVDEKLYKVTDEFPRIITDSFSNGIPAGVGMIEYNINLDGYDNLCIADSPDKCNYF